jgi:hypothetical protein
MENDCKAFHRSIVTLIESFTRSRDEMGSWDTGCAEESSHENVLLLRMSVCSVQLCDDSVAVSLANRVAFLCLRSMVRAHQL